MKKKFTAGIIVFILICSLCVTDFAQAAVKISKPKIVKTTTEDIESGLVVTYDCVYMGEYPQEQISESTDKDLYEKLENAEGWDENNDITVGKNRYRRLSAAELGEWSSLYDPDRKDSDCYYYFKFEPLKWRVLAKSGTKMLLMADQIIDKRPYADGRYSIGWGASTVRDWLNGYTAFKEEYAYDNFISVAFDETEREAILTSKVKCPEGVYGEEQGDDTEDKIFLLADYEMFGEQGAEYGFAKTANVTDDARRRYPNEYTMALGTGGTYGLRTRLDYEGVMVCTAGMTGGIYKPMKDDIGICPAMWVDMTKTGAWEYAGTVNSVPASNPKKLSAGLKNKRLTLKWKSGSGYSGIQIQVSNSRSFKKSEEFQAGKDRESFVIKNCSMKKKYYVRIRSYKTYKTGGKEKKAYGNWCTAETK